MKNTDGKNLRIALIGYGKMGVKLDEIASLREHSTIKIDPFSPKADFKQIDEVSLKNVDVAIDFSHPNAAMENFEKVLKLQIPLVAGVTGWYEEIPKVKALVQEYSGSFLYAANFSLGVHLFLKVCEQISRAMNNFPEYDISGFEVHHNQKADSPSGTAQAIAETLLKNIDRKNTPVYESPNRRIENNELSFPSIRCGSVPGTHTVMFDSAADTIELSHRARSRDGFALGAIKAAEWLVSKKGFYTIDNLIQELI